MTQNTKLPAWLLALAGTISIAGAATTLSVSELNKAGSSDGSVVLSLKTDETALSALTVDLKYDGASLTVTPPSSIMIPSAVSVGTTSVITDNFRVDSSSIGGGSLASGTVSSGSVNSGTLRLVISSSKKDAVLKDGTTFRVPVRKTNAAEQIALGFPVRITKASSVLSVGTVSVGSLVAIGPSARFTGVTSGGTVDATAGSPLFDVETLREPAVTVTGVRYFCDGVELASGSGAATQKAWTPQGSGAWSVYAQVTFSDGSLVQTNPVDFNVTGVVNPVGNGLYTGVVIDDGTLKAAKGTGSIQISTTRTTPASYSLRMVLEGRSYSAAGRFASNSVATPSFVANVGGVQKTLRMRIEQGLLLVADTISGVVTDGTISSSGVASGGSLVSKFTADRVVWFKGENEYNSGNNGQTGRYNAMLSDLGSDPVKVYGTGAVNVTALGVATGQFSLYDGTRVTSAGYLSKKGVWQPYVSLARGAGYLVGHLDFSDQNHAGWLGGDATWRRDASNLFSLAVEGGTFATGTTNPVFAVKAGANNVLVRFSGGGLATPVEQLGTYSGNKVVFPSGASANPNQPQVALNSALGTFSGSFKPVGDRSIIMFSGLVLQGQSRADAAFVRSGTLGSVRLTPVP